MAISGPRPRAASSRCKPHDVTVLSHPRCPSRTGNRVTANVPEAAHSMMGLRSVKTFRPHDGSGHVKISGSHPRSRKQPPAARPAPPRLSHVLPGSSYTFLGSKATFGDFAKVHAEIRRHGSSPGLSVHPVMGPGDAQVEKGGRLGKKPNMTQSEVALLLGGPGCEFCGILVATEISESQAGY